MNTVREPPASSPPAICDDCLSGDAQRPPRQKEGTLTVKPMQVRGRVGDWLEVHGPAGKPSRRGQITEVLRRSGREHYRVRWDEKHESIHYPAGGTVILPRAARSPRQRGRGGQSTSAD